MLDLSKRISLLRELEDTADIKIRSLLKELALAEECKRGFQESRSRLELSSTKNKTVRHLTLVQSTLCSRN